MFSAETLAYRATNSFTRIVTDYLAGVEALRPFYAHQPDLDGIRAALEARRKAPAYRQTLVSVLKRQYAGVANAEAVMEQIDALSSDDTFTVTTAHQPNLATGPLYFLYKILHAVRLASWLQEQLPGNRFVPVFYMGSEDADLDELNHFTVAGKRYVWETSQTGAVGRMTIDKQLTKLFDGLEGQIGVDPEGESLVSMLRACFTEGRTIQDATFDLVHRLFGRFGLVVLIADAPELKELMIPVFEKDLFAQEAAGIVSATSGRLQQQYDVQAHPRDINLFYLEGNVRSRIEQRGQEWSVVGTDIRFTAETLREELRTHPERFSPNVILRGLYQETILPNLAFIGGGGELAYWLQLKDLFVHYAVPFPVLVLRNSFLVMTERDQERAEKLGLSTQDLFLSVFDQLNQHLERRGERPQLNGEVAELEQVYERLRGAAASVDQTLGVHVDALRTRALSLLEALEKKMQRAARRHARDTERQLQQLKDGLFPKGGLQERSEHFSGFYAQWGAAFIDALLAHSGALEQQFTIIRRSR